MKMKRIMYSSISVLFVLIFISNNSPLFSRTNEPGKKSNILLITIDTLRTDRLSCYSQEHVETPNIDSLAAKSILYTRAFAHTPTTLPSHTNIMLGLTPPYHGVHDNLSFKVEDEHVTLAEHLKQQGYSTGAIVGAFTLDSIFGLSQGFDVYDGDFGQTIAGKRSAERPAEEVVKRALEFIGKASAPWFLWIHCYDPHDPYDPPEPYKTAFRNSPYDGEVAYVDTALKNLFQFLEDKDLYKKTVIVLTGDHGESLKEHAEDTHGYFAYNSTLWIPLIIYVPGNKSQVVEKNVSHIDLFPTICDALKITKPSFLEGHSIIPSNLKKTTVSPTIYFESLQPYYDLGWAPLKGIIQNKYKFIDSPIPELYDLEFDFNEKENISSKNNLVVFKKQLDEIHSQKEIKNPSAGYRSMDRDVQEKLKSLGYIGDYSGEQRNDFGPDEDIKVLLPLNNQAEYALRIWREGNTEKGIELLKDVISQNKRISISYIHLALIYKTEGSLNEAIQVLRLGLESIPESYLIFSAYMDHLFQGQLWPEIIQAFEKMDYRQSEFDPVIWNLAGLAYSRIGDTEKALALCEKAVSVDSDYPVSYSNLGNIQFKDFNLSASLRALQQAKLNYSKALSLDPQLFEAQFGIGLVFMYERNFLEAQKHLEVSLQLNPDYDAILYNLGIAYVKSGDKIRAASLFYKFKASKSYKLLSKAEKDILETYILQCK